MLPAPNRVHGTARGAMGNLVQLQPGEGGNAGLANAHGVLHLLKPVDMAKLTHMEHEYRCAPATHLHSQG